MSRPSWRAGSVGDRRAFVSGHSHYRLALLAVLLLAGAASAQAERYELGQRLKQFEKAWDVQTDAAARKRGLAGLPKATTQFFSFQLGEAGRTLDDARFALASDKPPAAEVQWATSLYPVVKRRLLAPADGEVEVSIQSFYTVKGDLPKGLSVRLSLGKGEPVDAAVEKLPLKRKVPFPKFGDMKVRDDLPLTLEIRLSDKAIVTRQMTISLIDGAGENWTALAGLGKSLDPKSLEGATLKERISLLSDLAAGTVPETDLPAARLFDEAQQIATLGTDKPYFTPDRPGQFWLSVPTAKDRTACRLFVPKGLDPKTPVPLVVAMHGAGGSENMFFETYCDGQIVKLCEKRGWLLVAPRLGLGFGLGGPPPIGEIVDALADRYPVDAKAVFVVGHSMGAAMTIDAVQATPGKFAGAAVLGGGGRVKKADTFATLPLFIGVGDKDFALRNAQALKKALTEAKAANVSYKEYADVEHLVIVREALPDVFELFAKQVEKK